MNNILNLDDEVLKADEKSKRVKQNIFEGKETKKPKENKKSNKKYK